MYGQLCSQPAILAAEVLHEVSMPYIWGRTKLLQSPKWWGSHRHPTFLSHLNVHLRVVLMNSCLSVFFSRSQIKMYLSHNGLTMSIILQFAEVNLLGKSVKNKTSKPPGFFSLEAFKTSSLKTCLKSHLLELSGQKENHKLGFIIYRSILAYKDSANTPCDFSPAL